MFEQLALGHLRLLAALSRHGSLSLAAERLELSQQAASLQLKRLREILGDPLFVRAGHGMVPTAYARQIAPQVEQVLALLHAIPGPGAVPLAQVERTLSISATDHAQLVIVPDLVRALRAAAPQVRLKVWPIESGNLVRRMQQGEIDLAFTSASHVPPGLVSTPLFAERYVCVADRPLAPAGGRLSLQALVRHDFVVVSPGVPGFDGSAGDWFAQQGLQRRVVVSVPSFLVAQDHVRRCGLVAFMPSRLLPCPGLAEVPLEKDPPGYEVVAARHPAALADPLVTWVVDTVRARLAAPPPPPL